MAEKGTKRSKIEIELDPKGWERFEAAVSAAVRAGPRHRPTDAKAKDKLGAATAKRRRKAS